MRIPVVIIMLVYLAFLETALSSRAMAKDPEPIPWDSLCPEAQQRLRPLEEDWGMIPSIRQYQLQRQAENWDRMGPEAQAKMNNRLERWESLSPEKKAQMRKKG